MSGLKKNLVSEFTVLQRRNLVDFKDKELSILQQAELLEINRSSLYYKPIAPSSEDLLIKRHIDKLYTAHPEFGYRRICAWLNKYDKVAISHKAVLRHMREMGIQAVYPREKTSTPNPENKIYPYLLKGLNINHPNHVWSIDITYIPICPIGKEMKPNGYDKSQNRQKWRCPYGAKVITSCKKPCSNAKYGRTFHTFSKDNLRLFPKTPCSSEKWKLVYSRRTSIERSNKREKVDYHLEAGRHRSTKMWYIRVYCIMMCQHIDAWYSVKKDSLKLSEKIFNQVA